mgnify:CR=1 FL=1
MEKYLLKEIVVQQSKSKVEELLIKRTDFDFISKLPQIVVLSGIRRCGKSTLMYQIRQLNQEIDYYLNFDDERLLHFSVDDFQMLYETFVELFGTQKHFYFDEIQNIKNWESFVRRLHNEGNKIYITGSNANLLSKELGTYLTGRHIQANLYPFSFKEYLDYYKTDFSQDDFYTTTGKAKLKVAFQNYMVEGGFPEYLQTKNTEQLKSLYNSILYRDIMVRNNITNELALRELGYYLAGNIGKPLSYANLSSILNVKHGQTVKNYVSYFEDTYLVFQLSKFDYSIKKQVINAKKIYFIDNALARNVSFRLHEDRGRFLENIVFLELKRRRYELFYHKEKKECDFVITEGGKVKQAIQVSVSIDHEQTRQRELEGLLDALLFYNLDTGLILTEDEEEELFIKGKKVNILPVWKWLLL